MLNVSSTWQAASRAQFRYQAYLEVSLEVAPPGIRQNATIDTNDTFSQASTDGILYTEQTALPYATLEPQRWLLNGKYNLLPEGALATDWWSKNAVNGNPEILLTFTFDKDYTIPGMYFIWDALNKTYPTSIRVVGYSQFNAIVSDVSIDNIDSYQGFFDSLAMTDVRKVELHILKWNRDEWRARIDNILFGLKINFDSYNKGKITSATQTAKSYPTSKDLPHCGLEFTVRNTDKTFDPTLNTGIAKYLARQQVINARWQFYTDYEVLENAPVQRYLTESFTIPKDSKDVTIKAVSRIELLDSVFTKGTYATQPRTMAEIAKYVLRNSPVFMEVAGQEPWSIPAQLNQFTSTAPIPGLAVNAILQLIALASGSWLTTRTTDGYIMFDYPKVEASKYCAIGLPQELGDPTIEMIDQLKSISVGIYSYPVTQEMKDVGKHTYVLTGTDTFTMKYSTEFATDVSAYVTGATVVEQHFYASYAVITLRANTDNSPVTINLTGKEVKKEVAYIDTYTDPLVADGRRVKIENPFITSVQHAKILTNMLLTYFLGRTKYTLDYIGYPQLEPLDRINQETIFGDKNVVVTGNTIKFNGGWSGTAETL